jgi:hypothetical protein
LRSVEAERAGEVEREVEYVGAGEVEREVEVELVVSVSLRASCKTEWGAEEEVLLMRPRLDAGPDL